MASLQFTFHYSFTQSGTNVFNFTAQSLNSLKRRCLKHESVCLVSRKLKGTYLMLQECFFSTKKKKSGCSKEEQPFTLDSDSVTHCSVTREIQFFRDTRNNFSQMCYSDTSEPYGPPLAILLPWKTLNCASLKKFIHFYGEKGFDVMTVNLTPQQLLFPCLSGGAMNVVSDLLQYLNESQKHRPYIFHGFSVAAYLYGEIMAQFSDQYELYRGLTCNVKGCLWDSPVDIVAVQSCIGKFYYPKNLFSRWRCNAAVRRHFKDHHHDSVCYWLRSRQSFCNPLIKAPNVFFVSYTDLMSNPCTLQDVQKCLDCNGIPTYQKTWWDSEHSCHFEKYCYEYLYGMILFLNLSNLFPNELGKYYSCSTNSSLTNLRLSKKARENICQ